MANITDKPSSFRTTALLLGLVTALLASLAPWGPIETRSFAHLHPAVYWGFNAFLTALVLASLATVRVLWNGRRQALLVAIALALLYLAVYVADLLAIFPTSPDPMPPMLTTVEVVDSLLATVLLVVAVRSWTSTTAPSASSR